uniref:Death domain-associated protein 6 n=1 Tax=Lygus hesperus TaxID=30085 RepID=A0A146L9R0_LYGHE
MVMASVITLSSDEDDGDIQIIAEKPGGIRPVKAESIDSLVGKRTKETNQLINRITPTLISNSVTISKIEPKSPSSDSKQLEVNGDALDSEAKEDSDDDIICLESEAVIKNFLANGVKSRKSRASVVESTPQHLVPKKESVLIPSDEEGPCDKKHDQNGNVHKTSNKSSKNDVILIDSDDESNDGKSSEDTRKEDEAASSDDEVQMLEADDLTNVCHVEESSEEGTSDSQDEGANKPGENETTKPNQASDGSSTSRDAQPSTSSSSTSQYVDEFTPDGPGNLTEKLLKQLNGRIKQYVGFSEENQKAVTKKIMKYYSSASEEFTQSQKFVDQIKNLNSEMSRLMALPNSKDMVVVKQITDKIKEFLGEFQRGSTQLTPKLNKLHRMLDKLNRRISKLEMQEVDSDSEYENPYVMLDRYRKRAVEVYNKIRQLEGKSNHADRLYLQEFIYAGVGPVPIQRALEKYYNKTKSFPDFSDVYKLVKKVNTEKNLGLTSSQAHLTAQQIFEDFGQKLKRRREYDDFLILRSYLPPECQIVDPAENDVALREKLQANKTVGKTEEDVLKDFVNKAIVEGGSSKKGTSKDEETGDDNSSKSDPEDSESEQDVPDKVFMDSDEEMEYFENVQDRRKPESDEGPPPKIPRTEGEDVETSGPPSSNNHAEEEPEAQPMTKQSFLKQHSLVQKGSGK